MSHYQVRVWWWVQVADGSWGRVPVGTGTVDAGSPSEDTEFSMTLWVRDALADVARARWDKSLPLGLVAVSEAQARILADRAPWVSVSLTPSVEMTPEDWSHGGPSSSPVADLAALATARGAVAHIDRMGAYVNTPIRDRAVTPPRVRFVESIAPGETDAMYATAISTALIDLDNLCNAATVTSSSSDVDPPVSGSWEITDEAHPLWVGRRRYSESITSDLVTTAEQAAEMARQHVQEHSLIQVVTLRHRQRLDLDPGDIVEVTNGRVGLSGPATVLSWSASITPDEIPEQTTTVAMDWRWT